MACRVGQACPPPPEEAAQDATFQRLQQRALPGPGVSEQFQLDPGLDGLSGPQLLDVAQFVVVLMKTNKNKQQHRVRMRVKLQTLTHHAFIYKETQKSNPADTQQASGLRIQMENGCIT